MFDVLFGFKVVDFLTTYKRKFPVDMAGFALNLKRLFKYPAAKFDSMPGLQESRFLQMLNATKNILEPKADNCSKVSIFFSFFLLSCSNHSYWHFKVLVWHTRTSSSRPILTEDKLKLKKIFYNQEILDTV
jgi:hypothetical protein